MKKKYLLEYSDKIINQTIERWRKEKPDLTDNVALQLIKRFEQIKDGLTQKLDVVALPDELKKRFDYKDINKYSLADMIKLLISVPESEAKIKKEAIKKFSEEYVPSETSRSYLARFFNNKENLKQAFNNGLDHIDAQDVKDLIPKNLHKNELYLDPRNYKWESFEQMMDSIFPSTKEVLDNNENSATTNADLLYNKNGLEIYLADDVNKCISYNPTITRNNKNIKKYGWCITQPGNTNYDGYRFSEDKPTFHIVFNRNKTSEANDDNTAYGHRNFIDKWHAFVVQKLTNGGYKITSAKNDRDVKVSSWEEIANIVDSETWNLISGLENVFQDKPLSSTEKARKFASGRNLNVQEFLSLSTEDKILYTRIKASKNMLTEDILTILPKIKISVPGRTITLANIAIEQGQTFTYEQLKEYESLAKRYATFRFRHTDYSKFPIPIPFAKYLNEDAKKKYIDTFKNNINSKIILENLGEESLKYYINKSVIEEDFIEPEFIKYIEDDKEREKYKNYAILSKNWELDEIEIDNKHNMPEISVMPISLSYKDLLKNKSKELIKVINSILMSKNISEYLLYSLPIILKDNKDLYILAPEEIKTNNYWDYNGKWVLAKYPSLDIIDKFRSIEISLDNSNFMDISQPVYDKKKIYPLSLLKIKDMPYQILKENLKKKLFNIIK